MRYFHIPATVALALALAVLLGEGPVLIFGVVAGFIAALVTVAGGLVCIKAHRDPRVDTEDRPRPTRRSAVIAGVGAAAIMIGYIALALQVLSATREYAKSPVTSSNLRGVGVALRLYVDAHSDYPPSLHLLIGDKGVSGWQLVSMGDPTDVDAERIQRGEYCSFEFRPGVGPWQGDPRIILAFERDPWTSMSLRILRQRRHRGRYVLFGDGRADRLDDDAFQAALRQDAAARCEFNWPVYDRE